MDIQTVLRWLVVAIVLIVAIVLLDAVLNIAGFLLQIGIRVLLILLLVAIILRFVDLFRKRR
ncbi:MAG: hypothetical protein GVY12_09470 [Bacteroidetes bacterium]|jgi:hypothetical protein|nr:hypothetical protein [Bacteroidota bacterium]